MPASFQGVVNPSRVSGSLLVDEAQLVTRPTFGKSITLERADVEMLFFHHGRLGSRLEYRPTGTTRQIRLWAGWDRSLRDALIWYGWPVSDS